MTRKQKLELTWVGKESRPKPEPEFAGKVKCVFIEMMYSTGSAFTHYDDWLEIIRLRQLFHLHTTNPNKQVGKKTKH